MFRLPFLAITPLELGEQVFPFVRDLTRRHRHGTMTALSVPDFGLVEREAANARLVDHARQVAIDRGDGVASLAKTFELRMMPVTARRAREHGAGEQPLPPKRHQSFRIEVTRMDRPEPHQSA
jgi:hypothetical protein